MSDLRTWEAWHKVHQPFELEWWRGALSNGHSSGPGWHEHWDKIREFIKPQGHVLDIGCGPRPPFAPCTVIDPLANEYQAMVPREWWLGLVAYAQRAEERISELTGAYDTVICWNALDHTIGWRTILDNMLHYGKDGARFAIATDFWEPFTGHPGYPADEFLAEIDKRFQVIERRENFDRTLALLLSAR